MDLARAVGRGTRAGRTCHWRGRRPPPGLVQRDAGPARHETAVRVGLDPRDAARVFRLGRVRVRSLASPDGAGGPRRKPPGNVATWHVARVPMEGDRCLVPDVPRIGRCPTPSRRRLARRSGHDPAHPWIGRRRRHRNACTRPNPASPRCRPPPRERPGSPRRAGLSPIVTESTSRWARPPAGAGLVRPRARRSLVPLGGGPFRGREQRPRCHDGAGVARFCQSVIAIECRSSVHAERSARGRGQVVEHRAACSRTCVFESDHRKNYHVETEFESATERSTRDTCHFSSYT